MSTEQVGVLLAKLLVSHGFPELAARSLVNESSARFAELGGRLTALSKIGARVSDLVPDGVSLDLEDDETEELLYKMIQLATNVKVYTLNEQLGLMSLMALPGRLVEKGLGDWRMETANGSVSLGDLKDFRMKIKTQPAFVAGLVDKFDQNGERVILINPTAFQLAVAVQFFFTLGNTTVGGTRKTPNVGKRAFQVAIPEGQIASNAAAFIDAFKKMNPSIAKSLKALNIVIEAQEDLSSILARNIQNGSLVVRAAQLVTEKGEKVNYNGLRDVAPRKKHFDEKTAGILRKMSTQTDKDLSAVQNWYAAVNYNAQNAFAMDFYGDAYQYGATVVYAIAVIEYAKRCGVTTLVVAKGAQADAIEILCPGAFTIYAVASAGSRNAMPVNVSNIASVIMLGNVLVVDATALNIDVNTVIADPNNVHFALNDPNVMMTGDHKALFNVLGASRLITINFGHWHPIWKMVVTVSGPALKDDHTVAVGTKKLPFRARNKLYLDKQIASLATHMRNWLTCQLAMKVIGHAGQAIKFDKNPFVVSLIKVASENIVELAKRGSRLDGDFVLDGEVTDEEDLVSTSAALDVDAHYDKIIDDERSKGRNPFKLKSSLKEAAPATTPATPESLNSAFEEEEEETGDAEMKGSEVPKSHGEEDSVFEEGSGTPEPSYEVGVTSPAFAEPAPIVYRGGAPAEVFSSPMTHIDPYGSMGTSTPARPAEDATPMELDGTAAGVTASLKQIAQMEMILKAQKEALDAVERTKKPRSQTPEGAGGVITGKKMKETTAATDRNTSTFAGKRPAYAGSTNKKPSGRGAGRAAPHSAAMTKTTSGRGRGGT